MKADRMIGVWLVAGFILAVAVNVMVLRGDFGDSIRDTSRIFWRLECR